MLHLPRQLTLVSPYCDRLSHRVTAEGFSTLAVQLFRPIQNCEEIILRLSLMKGPFQEKNRCLSVIILRNQKTTYVSWESRTTQSISLGRDMSRVDEWYIAQLVLILGILSSCGAGSTRRIRPPDLRVQEAALDNPARIGHPHIRTSSSRDRRHHDGGIPPHGTRFTESWREFATGETGRLLKSQRAGTEIRSGEPKPSALRSMPP
ncbi:hypothetical protein EDB86DRAFT_3072254 [Lactarius hatsudake]|nr:hypothetical protein EDB86DRAFT_3072254 [Lactarius hatsudake]